MFDKIWKDIAPLFKIKSIVTIAILVIYGILALRGEIDKNNVSTITATVICFYFGTQHDKSKEA